jgi:hypothetical protein
MYRLDRTFVFKHTVSLPVFVSETHRQTPLTLGRIAMVLSQLQHLKATFVRFR